MSYLHHLRVGINTLSGPCVFCDKEHTISFNSNDDMNDSIVDYFIHNKLIQDAFPNKSSEDREFMISGVCPDCWNETFPKEEDNDEPLDNEPEILLTQLHTQEDEVFEEVDDLVDSDSFIGDAIEDFLPTEWPPREDDK